VMDSSRVTRLLLTDGVLVWIPESP
jgi:hypothetical protein